jgi:hypothetical protein
MDFEVAPVESLDKVPENLRPLYVTEAKDGKYGIRPEFVSIAESINGFNKANKTLRTEVSTLKSSKVDLSPLAEYGNSPEEIAKTVTARITEAGGKQAVDAQKKVDAATASLKEAHAAELKKHAERNTGLQGQLYKLLVENQATAAVVEAKGIPDLLLPFIKNQVKVAEENGELVVQVVDAKGELRYGGTGSPMTIKELVSEMKGQEKFGRLFESEQQKGGTGMNPNGARRQPTQQQGELSANDKIAKGLANRARR